MRANNGEADIKNTLMDTGRGEERVRCMERITLKLTLPDVKHITNGNLLYVSGNANMGSGSFKRGGMGREVQEGGDIGIPMADSC